MFGCLLLTRWDHWEIWLFFFLVGNCSEGVRCEEMQVAAPFFLATIKRRAGSLLIKSNFLKRKKERKYFLKNGLDHRFFSCFYKCLCFCCSVGKKRKKKVPLHYGVSQSGGGGQVFLGLLDNVWASGQTVFTSLVFLCGTEIREEGRTEDERATERASERRHGSLTLATNCRSFWSRLAVGAT